MPRRISHVVGFDDCPFDRNGRGAVTVVGAVFAGVRLHGVMTLTVRRDGADATRKLVETVQNSRFSGHLQAVMLQGIAFGGFNVVDIAELADGLGLPVLTVMRRPPDFEGIRAALEKVPGGAAKWRRIERAGPVEAAGNVYIQRAGITLAQARDLIARTAVEGGVPEPLRTAHIIAGGIGQGESRRRV